MTGPGQWGRTEPSRDWVQVEAWRGTPSAEGPEGGRTDLACPGKAGSGARGSGTRGLGAVLWEGRSLGGMTGDGEMPTSFSKGMMA